MTAPLANGETPPVLYVPGAYQNWKPASALTLNPVPGSPGLYEGYVYMPGSGQQYFKFTNARDWDHTNYGDGGGGAFTTDGLAGGLSVPDGGYYELTADLGKNKWTATRTDWSIIGGATEGGWEKDTKMNYDATKEVWTVTTSLKGTGSFKFRANGAWVIDFAIDKSGELHYADNPFFGYTASLDDLTAPADGEYVVTLDLHTSGKYTYKLDPK